jgi:hypothetical protein
VIHVHPSLFVSLHIFHPYRATAPAFLVPFPRLPIQRILFIYLAALVGGLLRSYDLLPSLEVDYIKVRSFMFCLAVKINEDYEIALFPNPSYFWSDLARL